MKKTTTKKRLSEVLVEMSRDVLCFVEIGRYDWSERIAKSLSACAMVDAKEADRGWRLAREFGYFPTVLYVHRDNCIDRLKGRWGPGDKWEEEPIDPVNFNCPRCVKAYVDQNARFFTDSPGSRP